MRFEQLKPREQERAKAMFIDAGPGDGYIYGLNLDGILLCRRKASSHDRPTNIPQSSHA